MYVGIQDSDMSVLFLFSPTYWQYCTLMSIVRQIFSPSLSLARVLFVYCLAIFSLIDCLIIDGLVNCNIHKGYVVRVFVLRDVQCVDVFILFLIDTLFFFFYVIQLLINNLCKHIRYSAMLDYISYPLYLELQQSLMNMKHNELMNINKSI